MAFSSTITEYGIKGDKRVTRGTYTNAGGDTGGDIDTGLIICTGITLQSSGSAAIADAPTVNETFGALGIAGNAVTIVTTDGADGYWEAEGY